MKRWKIFPKFEKSFASLSSQNEEFNRPSAERGAVMEDSES